MQNGVSVEELSTVRNSSESGVDSSHTVMHIEMSNLIFRGGKDVIKLIESLKIELSYF